MNVTEYIDILRDPRLSLYEDGWYTSNNTGKQGYRATFSLGKKWYWYSVSRTSKRVHPFEVAEAIASGRVGRSKSYKTSGFEATVRMGEHSYMLNEGDTKP